MLRVSPSNLPLTEIVSNSGLLSVTKALSGQPRDCET
jgi:hypothetical protein